MYVLLLRWFWVAFATGLRMCASTLRMYVDKWTQYKRNASSGSISFQYRITDDIILFIFPDEEDGSEEKQEHFEGGEEGPAADAPFFIR